MLILFLLQKEYMFIVGHIKLLYFRKIGKKEIKTTSNATILAHLWCCAVDKKHRPWDASPWV